MGATPPLSDYPAASEVDGLLNQEPLRTTVDGISITFKSSDTP